MSTTARTFALLAVASAAHAQTTLSNPASPSVVLVPLDEVVVTATRTQKSSFDALAAVDVIGDDYAQDTQARTAGDLLTEVPGATTQYGTRSTTEQYNIRGLDDRRINIRVDGASRDFRGEYKGRSFLNPAILKRVEVAKGSNSVLDGSGALGGTIQFFTKDASDYLTEGETKGVTVGLGHATNGGELSANVAAYAQNEALDVLAFHESSTAGNIRLGGDDELPFSESNSRQWLAKGTWQMTDATALTATFTDYYDQGDSTSNPIRTGAFAGFSTNRRVHSQNGQLKLNHNPLDNQLVDLTVMANLGKTGLTEVVTQSGASFGRRDETDFTEQSLEAYNTSRFTTGAVAHAFTLGAETGQDKQEGSRPGAGRSQLYPNAKATNVAVYAQDEMTYGKASLMPGIRWESYKLKDDASGATNDGEQIVGKLAAGYKFTPNTNGYASVAQSYRAPNLFEAFAAGPLGGPLTLVANPTLKPEEATNYELGLKHRVFPGLNASDNLTFKASVFQTDFKNLIERQSTTPPFIFGFRNVEKARMKGAEIAADYNSDSWFGRATVGVQRGDNLTQDQPLLDVPPLMATLTVGKKGQTRHGQWSLAYTGVAADDQDRVPPNDLLVSRSNEYLVHNLRAEFIPNQRMFKQVSLNMAVENLLDERYRPVTSFQNARGLDVRTGLSIKF